MSVADALPVYHHREHHSIHVAASPADALAAAKTVTLAEVPLVRTLFRLRGLRTPPRGSLWDAMGRNGFHVEGEDTLTLMTAPACTPRRASSSPTARRGAASVPTGS